MKIYLCHNRTELPHDLWEEKRYLPKQSTGYKRFATQNFLRLSRLFHSLEQLEGIEHRLEENKKREAEERAKIRKDFDKIFSLEIEEKIYSNLVEKSKERAAFRDKYCQRIEAIDSSKYLKSNENKETERIEKHCERIGGIDANKFLESSELRKQERIKERREIHEYLDKVLGPKKLTH